MHFRYLQLPQCQTYTHTHTHTQHINVFINIYKYVQNVKVISYNNDLAMREN